MPTTTGEGGGPAAGEFTGPPALAGAPPAAGAPLVPEGIPTARRRKALLFRVAGECFALPLERVREVCPRTAITRVPRAPSQVIGVMNLRGRPVVLVDLPRCLNLPGGGPDAPHMVLLDLGDQDLAVGLLADRIDQVVEMDGPGPGGTPVSGRPGGADGPDLVELGGHVATLLDPMRVLAPALPGVASGGMGEAA